MASDPLITPDKQPFTVKFPKGDFTTFVHKKERAIVLLYVEIIFGNQEVTTWEMAVCDLDKTSKI